MKRFTAIITILLLVFLVGNLFAQTEDYYRGKIKGRYQDAAAIRILFSAHKDSIAAHKATFPDMDEDETITGKWLFVLDGDTLTIDAGTGLYVIDWHLGATQVFSVDSTGKIYTASTITVGAAGAGADVTLHSATSGDNFLWDASEEQLVITGTDAQTALNVADGHLSVADAATISLINTLVDTGSVADDYGGTITPAPAALVDNMVVYMRAGIANTGACTLEFNGLTVKNIKTNSGADPANNDILTASMAILMYNNTNWILLNPATTSD